MKKAIMLFLFIAGTLSFHSCTTDSLSEIEAEMEAFATDGQYDPNDPKELPDEEDEG